MHFDAVILAMGSVPKTLPIPGADDPKLWTVDAVFGQEQLLGHRVVVVGGAHSGCETALYLAQGWSSGDTADQRAGGVYG